MGRPRLYHTPEEKRAANRLKSKKHYEKNREAVLKQRQRVAKKRKDSKKVKVNKSVQSKRQFTPVEIAPSPCADPDSQTSEEAKGHHASVEVNPSAQAERSQIEIIHDRVQKLTQEFEETLCGRSGRGYLTLLCIGFEAHHQSGTPAKARDYVMDREIELRKIQKALEKYRRMVEEIDGIGIGEEWNRIDEVVGRVCQVVDWIDDVIWNAMVDPADMVMKFRAGELQFQIESA